MGEAEGRVLTPAEIEDRRYAAVNESVRVNADDPSADDWHENDRYEGNSFGIARHLREEHGVEPVIEGGHDEGAWTLLAYQHAQAHANAPASTPSPTEEPG